MGGEREEAALTANKMFTQIEDALAGHSAHVNANLINIAHIFAKLDERLAGVETKLDQLLAQPSAAKTDTDANASARAKQLIALLDERIKAALEREQRALCQATGEIVRDVLAEFVAEFKHARGELELKLKQVEALLAARPPPDPPPRPN
jgi:ABC-type transporter Mla subunit MlaD